MKAKLTKSKIESLQAADKPYEVVDTEVKGFLLRIQPSGRKTFYFSYRNMARKRQRIKIGVFGPSTTAPQAREKAIKYAGQVRDGLDVQANKALLQQQAEDALNKTLGMFIKNHYQSWAEANLKTGKKLIEHLHFCYKPFMSIGLADISVPLIEKWRVQRLESGVKPITVNRSVGALTGLMSRAVEWEFIEEHPLKKLKPLPEDRSPNVRYLTPEENTRLYAALAERDESKKKGRPKTNKWRKAKKMPLLPDISNVTYADRITPMVIVSLKTGMRRGELFDLLWSDINFDERVITIRAEISKSKRTRHIPLNQSAIDVLKLWQKQAPQLEGRVFPADDGGRLKEVRNAWEGVLKIAKMSRFRWHDLRHDFASQLVMKGVPLNTVRELCGHADMNTTLRYAHLAPDHKSDAVALLD
jgi:integrase